MKKIILTAISSIVLLGQADTFVSEALDAENAFKQDFTLAECEDIIAEEMCFLSEL